MMTAPVAAKRQFDLRLLPLQLLFIAQAVGLPFGLGTAPSIFRDGDVSWQVAAGEWILHHGYIPTTDPFSFTARGHPWVAMEWLSEIIYATAFRLGGFAGLATVVAAALIAVNAILFFYLQRRVSTILLGATLLGVAVVLAPFALARPHVLAWPLLAAWTTLLLKAAETGSPPPMWSALLLVVWTNAHASFPLAVPIAAAIGFDALVQTKWKSWRQWCAFGLVSILALMANANGLAGLEQPFKTSSLAMLPLIGEWHPTSTAATPHFFAVLLAAIGALLWTGVKIPFGRLALLLFLLTLAFLHVRHQSAFIIVAACVLPPLCGTRPTLQPAPTWMLAAALPLLAFRFFVPLTPPESAADPRGLIAAIPQQLRSQPVFNEYTFGGPLILAGVRPYVDGRAEIYGDGFVINYMNIIDGDVAAFDATIRRYGITWVMLQQGNKALRKALDSSPQWKRIYSDRVGVIYARR